MLTPTQIWKHETLLTALTRPRIRCSSLHVNMFYFPVVLMKFPLLNEVHVHQVRLPAQVRLQYLTPGCFDRFSLIDCRLKCVSLDDTQSAFHSDADCDNWDSSLFLFKNIAPVQTRRHNKKSFAVRTMLHNKCVYNLKLWFLSERYQFSGE